MTKKKSIWNKKLKKGWTGFTPESHFEGLPVFYVTIDDCEECGVQSIELTDKPLEGFIVINKDETT